ncbi:MAG: tetratricopeptide repeat protein [Rhodoplanes sp.]|uniref:tetratricopeptide repeat protein n=1 Tax=Rhodoplanes sp. TaxID=1968906 RepID=UPI0017E6F67F|nr:tetratricopeptide repeat protein [Rhodoplanes sp.]NVO13488.1 tetratricopeptide repeat protein [Rhodoplanes sp.]
MTPGRHPWLVRFEDAPEEAFGDLLAGYADIHPYERADAPDAAHMLFGPLDPKDRTRALLGPAILSWLEKRRKAPLPAARPKLQRHIREISEAFEIVALLNVADAAVELRRRRLVWDDWTARLVLSPARDARAAYWRTLALTQKLAADKAPDLSRNGLAPIWQQICREAGARLPRHYLSIGLLGLRRLPGVDKDSELLPWAAGLAQWALARNPSDAEFKAEWLGLKPLYPRAPERWRKLVSTLLSTREFRDNGIEPPGWWHVDPDFESLTQKRYIASGTPLRSPMPEDCDHVIGRLDEPFETIEPLIDDLFQKHRRYLSATGHSHYFVRAVHMLGRELIVRGEDARHARAVKAQALAREGLRWEPYNRHLGALWCDALVADGAPDAAELVGWERVRRDQTDVNARTQLATLLVNELGRLEDAEALLKDTIATFPHDVVARTELAELLIFEDRIDEAAEVVDDAIDDGAADEATYSLRARLWSHAGRPNDALRSVEDGIALALDNGVLKRHKQDLSKGKSLPLKSQAFREPEHREAAGRFLAPASDPELAEVARLGTIRRLRFELESVPVEDRKSALDELAQILREDPTFAYAELLAARHRIWEAEPGTLPPFAAAFEDALAAEDRERLEKLAARQPKLRALILVAQTLLGDAAAAQEIERWLGDSEAADLEPAIAGLRSALRPALRLVEDGRSLTDVFSEIRPVVVRALHDSNEATLGDALLAA